MAYLLEITGSIIIGGLILIIILNLNSTITSSSGELKLDTGAQKNITSLIEEIEYDFRKIGYRVADSLAFLAADSDAVTFQYDLDNNGAADTISYFLSDTSALSSTPNPRDVLLYRTVNAGGGQPVTSNLGVTNFNLLYFNSSGNLTTTPADIKAIKFELTIESIYSYDGEYVSTYVERLITPNNLR